MSVTSIMNIAKNALFAQQSALQVVSNNVANVNTEGYARQEAVLNEETAVMTDLGMFLGNGVTVSTVMSHYDKYLESSLSKENTTLEEQKTYAQYLGRVETVLDENNTYLTANITSFFNSWQDLSSDPLSLTSKTSVAKEGANLASTIRNVYDELKDMQYEANNNVAQKVKDVNNILHSIAQLNGQIYTASAGGFGDAAFVNQRTQLIKELSGMVNIQSFQDKDGGMTIMTTDGKALVDRETVFELGVVTRPGDGLYDITMATGPAASVDITDSISGGSLKALVDLRDNHIKGFMDSMNDLAESLITEVNTFHSSGYTASGTTGINFFSDVSSNFAENFDISNAIKADPNNIAVSSSASNSSDNSIALAITNLGTTNVKINGQDTTYIDYGSSIASQIGTLSKNAQDLTEYHQTLMTAIQKQRDSVSGVSIDEEMTNLIKFQYAYQAASRLINVANTLMDSLLEISR
jgi:flagellar hook-associated protein 1